MEILNTKASLEDSLRENILEVTFTKVNGDHRYMICTRDACHIPAEEYPAITEDKMEARVESPDVVRVYDITAKGWRSFRIDSLISASLYEG